MTRENDDATPFVARMKRPASACFASCGGLVSPPKRYSAKAEAKCGTILPGGEATPDYAALHPGYAWAPQDDGERTVI